MAPDSYSKLPLSGSSGFATEPQELPLQTSMGSSVPLPLATADQSQSGIRSQYNYTTTSTPQLAGSTVTIGPDSTFSMPRYVDSNPRPPSKSPRHHGHQSVHSNGSIHNADAPDYRYGSFRGMTNGVGDVSPGGNAAPSRDYYPSASTWTTTAAEPSPSLAYAGNDGRSYSGVPPLKHETAPYSSSTRGSFDTMNNYSWTAA